MELPRKRFFDFSDVHLYCITTEPKPGQDYRSMVEKALAGGADAIQLRDKKIGTRALIELCKDLQKLCDKTGAFFILNDRVDVALAADIDGVHVGQDDLPVRWVRQILGHRKIVGCSTHSVSQAFQAQGDGADYVSCGPLFATPTKPDYTPVGPALIKQYSSMVKVPFVAIGGVDDSNVESIIKAGADRVAVVRAVCGADRPEETARSLKDKILQAKRSRQETLVRR